MPYKVVDRGGDLNLVKGLKNSWKFSWLETEVDKELTKGKSIYYMYHDFLVKIDKPGYCKCTWCDALLKHLVSGLKDIKRHVVSKKHRSQMMSQVDSFQF